MSLTDMWRPRGRRRFNQADAIAARQAAEHWMFRALAAEDALETTTRDRDEFEAALDVASDEYNALDARHADLRNRHTEVCTELANRKAVHLDAPADLGRVRDRAEETTESINVTTLRSRYGTNPVPAMPFGGAA